jgi:hypothetical protein
VLACKADLLFTRGCWDECFRVTTQILHEDPYALQCLPLHLGAALQLGNKNELFIRGHRLVEEYPQQVCVCVLRYTFRPGDMSRSMGVCPGAQNNFAVAFG